MNLARKVTLARATEMKFVERTAKAASDAACAVRNVSRLAHKNTSTNLPTIALNVGVQQHESKMARFSSLFDFMAHHQQNGADASSSSSSESTLVAEPIEGMKRPLSEEADMSSTNIAATTSRRVSFFGSVKVQFIECLEEYTADERNACWFDRDEFDQFKRERRSTVKKMEREDDRIDDGQHYFRGVEGKTREGSQRKQWNIMEASMAVFDEQYCHQLQGDKDTITLAIAEAYAEVSCDARAIARERGEYDQQAALELYTKAVVSPATDVNQLTRSHRAELLELYANIPQPIEGTRL